MISLTEEIFLNFVDEKSFLRGEKYYKQGRVHEYKEDYPLVSGKVIGTDYYFAEFNLTDYSHSCNCYVHSSNYVCKHVVALVLNKLRGINVKEVKIKKTNYRNRVDPDENIEVKLNEYDSFVDDLDPEKLKLYMKNCIANSKEVRTYFDRLILENDPDKFNFADVESQIKKILSKIRFSHNYYSYRNKLLEATNQLMTIFQSIPLTDKTCIFTLKQAVLIDKKLSKIDDSDGILQDVIGYFLVFIAQGIIASKISVKDFLNFIAGYETCFDFVGTVFYSILSESEVGSTLYSEVMNILERNLYKKSSEFTFQHGFQSHLYWNILKKKEPQKFVDTALLFKDLPHVVTLLKEYYFETSQFQKYLDLFNGDFVSSAYLMSSSQIETALIHVDDKKGLIALYIAMLASRFNIKIFLKLQKLLDQKTLDRYISIFLEQQNHLQDKISLLLALKKYNFVTTLFENYLKGKNDIYFFETKESIIDLLQKTALKIVNSDCESAKYLFNLSCDYYFEKFISGSTNFNAYISLLNLLLELQLFDIVHDQIKKSRAKFPTRKKFLEALTALEPKL